MTNTAEPDKHELKPADGNSIVGGNGVGVMNEEDWLREYFPLLTSDGIKAALAERLREAASHQMSAYSSKKFDGRSFFNLEFNSSSLLLKLSKS